MSTKKATKKKASSKKSKKVRTVSRDPGSGKNARVQVTPPAFGEGFKEGDDLLSCPVRRNPESAEERERKLAARKALTLRVFRMAYENHHRRKAS